MECLTAVIFEFGPPVLHDAAVLAVDPCNHLVVSTFEVHVSPVIVQGPRPVAPPGLFESLARNAPQSILFVVIVDTNVETN